MLPYHAVLYTHVSHAGLQSLESVGTLLALFISLPWFILHIIQHLVDSKGWIRDHRGYSPDWVKCFSNACVLNCTSS